MAVDANCLIWAVLREELSLWHPVIIVLQQVVIHFTADSDTEKLILDDLIKTHFTAIWVHLCVWVCVFSVDLTCRLIGVCRNDPYFHRLSWMLLLFIKFYKTCMMWPWRTLSSDNSLVIWKNQRWTQDVWAGRARKINWQPLALEENCKGHFCSISLNMGAAFLCRLNTVNVGQLIKRLSL